MFMSQGITVSSHWTIQWALGVVSIVRVSKEPRYTYLSTLVNATAIRILAMSKEPRYTNIRTLANATVVRIVSVQGKKVYLS